ncbi:MAG: 30S ribosomal protein S9 [Candidatus Lokiarchaeota archaeon]|nr:30S ribosomal protein S9 [Candidatus Lokiarchaeota archaeon]
MVKIVLTSGKRKTAIARATTRKGKGKIKINKVPIEIVKPNLVKEIMIEPLYLLKEKLRKNLNIDVNVFGGGRIGQAQAVAIALARAIVQWYDDKPEIKNKVMEYNRALIAGDSRRTEPKKFGGPSARARFQKSFR